MVERILITGEGESMLIIQKRKRKTTQPKKNKSQGRGSEESVSF